MIYSNFTGRLAADAEIKVTKNGKNFTTYRVAVDDFKNGESTTTWVRVSDYTEHTLGMAQHLKRGSLVIVQGTIQANTYVAKDSSVQVSLDVNAFRTDFGPSTKSNSDENNTDNTTSTPSPQATVNASIVADCGTLKRPELVASPSVVAASTVAQDDDLPF